MGLNFADCSQAGVGYTIPRLKSYWHSTMDKMKIRGIAPWFGAKRQLASRIVAALGPHNNYLEPFCGSLAVLMAKPVSRETANDLHGDLINLARVLKHEDSALKLYADLSRIVVHEAMFHEAYDRYRRLWSRIPVSAEFQDVGRAVDFMVCSWLGRNGMSGTPITNNRFCVRHTANGGSPTTRWSSVVESIPAWHMRLRNVTMLNRDAFELLEKFEDDTNACIYVDPPYIAKGKGTRYVHDFEPSDHERLVKLLRRFRHTHIVVSYYDHPLLEKLYPDWTRTDYMVTKSLVSSGQRDKRGAVKVMEVLLTNRKQKTLFTRLD